VLWVWWGTWIRAGSFGSGGAPASSFLVANARLATGKLATVAAASFRNSRRFMMSSQNVQKLIQPATPSRDYKRRLGNLQYALLLVVGEVHAQFLKNI
jgi:hypothetical protein